MGIAIGGQGGPHLPDLVSDGGFPDGGSGRDRLLRAEHARGPDVRDHVYMASVFLGLGSFGRQTPPM
jgi:hypothetical protein